MQAVIKTGGKQVIVNEGDVINVELLNANVGDDVVFDQVCMLLNGENSVVGTPTVKGAEVTAKIIKQVKGPKLRTVFFRRRHDSMTTKGHRQNYHTVKINAIKA